MAIIMIVVAICGCDDESLLTDVVVVEDNKEVFCLLFLLVVSVLIIDRLFRYTASVYLV